MVFGWSGLMIFIEFMNEMRRPYEFVKSFCFAEALVFVVYIMYGSYVYGFQGQYTLPVAFQGVSNYTWQSIGNGLSLWTYNMASTTYLNIAVKVVYWFLFEEVWRGPDLMSGRGFVYWAIVRTYHHATSTLRVTERVKLMISSRHAHGGYRSSSAQPSPKSRRSKVS